MNRLLLHFRFLAAFGVRGIPIPFQLYLGRTGRLVCISLPGGHRVYVRKRSSEVAVFHQVFIEREADFSAFPQSRLIMQRYLEIVSEGRKPLVLVCGANTGLTAIFFALSFPDAIVVAVEPSELNFEMLLRNVALYKSIVPIRAGVWDRKTYLKITNPTAEPYEFQTEECDPADPEALATLTITELLERFPDSDPLLIKIDVEGAEQALFGSNTNWIEKMPLLIVELHDWQRPQQEISASFRSVAAKMRCDLATRGENVFIFNWAALGEPNLRAAARSPLNVASRHT